MTQSSRPKDTAKLNKIIAQQEKINERLKDINKKQDMLVIIGLAEGGLNLPEVAKVMGVSEDTIERMLPYGKLKSKTGKE
jgi:DNA-directed RNA polymerase specialized sigma24 family protein